MMCNLPLSPAAVTIWRAQVSRLFAFLRRLRAHAAGAPSESTNCASTPPLTVKTLSRLK